MNKIFKSNPKTKEKPFPKLMQNKTGRFVWFINDKGEGAELYDRSELITLSNSIQWDIGEFEDTDTELIVNTKD